MASKELRHAARIERKPDIPDSAQTPDRDKVADWIEQHAADDWLNWTFTDVANEYPADISRQHVSNTVENYFQPATDNAQEKSNGNSPTGNVNAVDQLDEGEVPDWVIQKVKDAYREGMQDGIEIGRGLD